MPLDTVKPRTELREYLPDGGLRLNLHYGQVKAWNSIKRIVAIISGTQGGKTSFMPSWLLREIKTCGSGAYLYATPTFALLDKKALPEFLEVFEKKGKLGKFSGTKMKFVFSEAGMRYIHGANSQDTFDHYDPANPTTVYFGYASKSDSLESMTCKAAVLDEAGQEDFKLDSWFAILRRLSIHQGRILIGTTPYNFGWLYTQIYQRWLAGDDDIEVVNFPSTANPLFPMAELERARRTMPDWKFKMFYYGQFTKPAGLIYDIFDHDTHVIKPFDIPQNWMRFGAIDFGGMNKAATFYAEEPNTGVAYMFDEYFPHQYKPLRDHVVDMSTGKTNLHVNINKNQVTYKDTDWMFVAGTTGERQWRIEMAQYGLHAAPSFVREVELGIDKGYSMLKRKKIRIFDTCVQTINEFNTYSRLTNADGEIIPNTIENKSTFHLLDSYRYFGSYFGNEDINPNWSDDALSLLHPDGELSSLMDMMDDENIDLDNPMVQRIIRKHKADLNKPMAMKADRLTEEDRNPDGIV